MNILRKQLDESITCPLCQAAMFLVDAEEFDQEIQFYECSHCQHRLFNEENRTCHCATCTQQRKKLIQQTRQQEQLKYKIKDERIFNLNELSFLHKLFFALSA